MIRLSEGQLSVVLSILQDSVFPSAIAPRSLFCFGDGQDCVEDEVEDLWFRLDIRQLFYAPTITFRTLHSSQANKNYGAEKTPRSAILLVLTHHIQFHAIHRVGKRRSSDETSKVYPRPIIARFLCGEDRDMVLHNSSQYENVYITEDCAKVIQMERKVLIKTMFLACKKGMNAKMVDRNLVVSNVYNVGNIPDNLKETSTLNSNSR